MDKNITHEDFSAVMKKIEEMKKSGTVDLSLEEDLSIAIMNLVSLEEHFFFTAEKTGRDSYFEVLREVREMRKSLLARMMDKNEGETWCISKHLLAATMRLFEVGTKLQSEKKPDEAKKMFDRAYALYSLFWGLRLKLIDASNVSRIDENAVNVHDTEKKSQPWTMQDILEKMVNCCDE